MSFATAITWFLYVISFPFLVANLQLHLHHPKQLLERFGISHVIQGFPTPRCLWMVLRLEVSLLTDV